MFIKKDSIMGATYPLATPAVTALTLETSRRHFWMRG
jgi:hypothetical protein